MFNQDDDFYLIGLNILITCFAGKMFGNYREKLHVHPVWELRVKLLDLHSHEGF